MRPRSCSDVGESTQPQSCSDAGDAKLPLMEVIFLGHLNHPHLVKLIGYCCEEEHRLLGYEYMPRVSSKGLESLHEAEKPVIYRDFKANRRLQSLKRLVGLPARMAHY